MEQIEITVSRRIRTGKNLSRRLRHKGRVPGIVYGLEIPPVPIEVDEKSLRAARHGSDNAVVLLKMQGTEATRHVMVKEAQRDPVTGVPLHVDFLRIDLSKEVEVEVPVHVLGTAAGIKEGGLLEFVFREVRVACLPSDIPRSFDIDVSHLRIGEAVRVAELTLPPGVKVLQDLETVLAVVHAPKAEAEAPAAAAEAEVAEPVVIAKGKEAKEGAPEAKPGETAKAAKPERAEKEKK